MNKIQWRQEGHKVFIIINGKALEMPWEKADEIARGATIVARRAEEYVKANRIIADNALMQRAGFPIGLSDNPAIREETVKTALYDGDLRKYLPAHKNVSGIGGVQTRGAVGSPTLTKRKAH